MAPPWMYDPAARVTVTDRPGPAAAELAFTVMGPKRGSMKVLYHVSFMVLLTRSTPTMSSMSLRSRLSLPGKFWMMPLTLGLLNRVKLEATSTKDAAWFLVMGSPPTGEPMPAGFTGATATVLLI